MYSASPPPALARVQQSGVPIATAFEAATTLSGVRQTEPADARVGGFTSSVQASNMRSGAGLSKDLIPLPYRASSLGKVRGDRSNSPKIEVHTFGDNGTSAVPTFDDFILTDVSAQDAEKIDVCETFGVPHLFTSGRFVRRATFQGIARTAPANYAAENNPRYSVSQSTMLRVFYDQYLRATQQADNGQYTCIIVDGHTYTGWVTTFNDQRDAGQEQWMPFTFSMIVTERKSADDADAMKNLAALGFANAKKLSRFLATQAKAELSDAVGSCEITWLRNGNSVSTLVLGDLTVKDGTDVKGAFSQKVAIRLDKGTPQRISVACDTPGVVLVKDDGTELHGTDLKVQEPVNVTVKVLDFATLWEVLKSKGTANGTTQTASVTFTVTPTHGNTITATMGLTLDGVPVMTLADVSVALASNPGLQYLSGGTISSVSDVLKLKSERASAVLSPSNVTSLLFRARVLVGGRPASAAVISAFTASVLFSITAPYDKQLTGSSILSAEQALPCTAAVAPGSLVIDPGTSTVSFTLDLTIAAAAPLATTNPFTVASDLHLEAGLDFKVPGYAKQGCTLSWPLDLVAPAQIAAVRYPEVTTLTRTTGPQDTVAYYTALVPSNGVVDEGLVLALSRIGAVSVTLNGAPLSVPLDGTLKSYRQKTIEQMDHMVAATLYLKDRQLWLRVKVTVTLTIYLQDNTIRKQARLGGWVAAGMPATLPVALAFPPSVKTA